MRYLNPADHHPERIRKTDKLFGHELVFEDIKFPVGIKDIQKIDHNLHRGKRYFCRYSLQAFGTEEILKSHINDCFKINCKQIIQIPKEGEYVKFKNYERKIKSSFMIYADFESILVPEGKLNPDESYTKKYQKPCCFQLWL